MAEIPGSPGLSNQPPGDKGAYHVRKLRNRIIEELQEIIPDPDTVDVNWTKFLKNVTPLTSAEKALFDEQVGPDFVDRLFNGDVARELAAKKRARESQKD